MNIQDENYKICFDAAAHVVEFHGTLRLNGMAEYAPIFDLLSQASANPSEPLTLDLRKLEFLNSSGIAMLSKFVIGVRNGEVKLNVIASSAIPWQGKSLTNLKRLMPGLVLEIRQE
jgi:hypothetical protein